MDSMWGLIFPHPPPKTTPITPDQMPAPYNTLLPPNHHMTQTLEAYFKQPVQLNVIATRIIENSTPTTDACADAGANACARENAPNAYARAITLSVTQPCARNVQFAVVQVNLDSFEEGPRAEILSEKVPLGRTLKNFNIKTQVDVYQLVKIEPGNEVLEKHLVLPTYGRLGLIYCNGKPGIYILEILTGDITEN